jgi:hypothetical protein
MQDNHCLDCELQPTGFDCICDHVKDVQFNEHLESEESRIYEK